MMNERERIEIEERLRRTYEAVAAATGQRGSAGGELRSISNRSPSRRTWVGAAAASLVLVMVAAVAWLATQRDGAVADDRNLVHVLPGVLPSVDEDRWKGVYVLTTIETSPDRDQLVWSADEGSVRLTTDRRGVVRVPPGSVESIRGGSEEGVRTTTEAGVSLWWSPRPDLVVEVAASGDGAVERLDEVVNSLFLVDADAWALATRVGGFTRESVLLRQQMPNGGPRVAVSGNVHEGFGIETGGQGFPLSGDVCTNGVDWDRADPNDRTIRPYLIIVSAGPPSMSVTLDGTDLEVSLTQPFPGVPIAIGHFEFERERADALADLRCDRNGR